ncbi:uncharacterized protein LOC117572667 [Drosophila albomicans]|uniref:Uncharacterized protein LOC117572667 n=1 Tax=Drosophila albomicans TaxID=7291 RepID=A0A6P8XGE9_DROAB|nr:uncharacterized protein LOC117572667 [Drosophila albomicans]
MFRLLLVVTILCFAQSHCAVTSQHPRLLQTLGDATIALQAAQQSLEDELKHRPSLSSSSSTLTSVSVVQDWSLVCKELCGAGLGVTPCANYCQKSGGGMVTILNTVFDWAKCGQLTGSQNASECKGAEPLISYGDRLCSSFCYQRRRTLNGCSPCQLLSVSDEEKDEKEKEKVSAVQNAASHGSGDGASLTMTATMQLAVKPQAEIAGRDASETPDWDEVCKTLCKTGDGGSLCNCDLSPFFT